MSVVVSGILKSPDGAVVAGAQIILTALTTSPDVLSGASASAVTTSAGYYGLTVLPGNYALTVSVRGKSQVYGRVTLDGSETNVTLNMLLRRNLVEVSIPGELLTGFRQIQNNVADDLATMQQLATDVSGKNDMASRSANDAAASAESAARSEENAGKSAASVLQSEQNAQTSAQSASGSALAAKTSEDNARKSEAQVSQSAESARLAAENAARDVAPAAAEQIRLAVRDDADRALRSAEQAALSASGVKQLHDEAGAARDRAVQAENSAVTQAQQAGQSALSASQSEASAGESARQAAADAVASEDSSKASVLSAQASATSEKNSGTSEQNAGTSAANAKVSEDAAAQSAVTAKEQATIAQNAAKTAATDAVSAAVPEAVRQIKDEISTDVSRAETAATQAEASGNAASNSELKAQTHAQDAQQALTEAQQIAKTPGPSAYDIWKSKQFTAADTSIAAFLEYMKGKPGPPGKDAVPVDLKGINSSVAIPAAGFNAAKQYPLYGHEQSSALPGHPIPGSTGNEAWGTMWEVPRGSYSSQLFANYNAKMFFRISANYGWSPWWQLTGEPVSGVMGTQVFCSCNLAVAYGTKVAGGFLTPVQTGTWFAQGAANPGEKTIFMKVR
ncbi:carboxypeptidase regulatory-like domain-containing protein [Salmonella enterica]|nr:carboxypeptidase regulatory-like domain-containing protein [Salmonella enterica]ELX2839965.1 carboxypeptidase regulatory-like domain-containing protein [Salmonella enterica]